MHRRPSAYAAIADLVHHVRTELSPDQLARVAKLYSALIHNPYLGHNLHTLFAKMMFGLIENITSKDTPQGAARVLGAMFETCVDKVDAMTNVLDSALERLERAKAGDESFSPSLLVEKARPVAAAVYAVEKPEEVIHGASNLPVFQKQIMLIIRRVPITIPDAFARISSLPRWAEEMRRSDSGRNAHLPSLHKLHQVYGSVRC
jgi:hypothetical protein